MGLLKACEQGWEVCQATVRSYTRPACSGCDCAEYHVVSILAVFADDYALTCIAAARRSRAAGTRGGLHRPMVATHSPNPVLSEETRQGYIGRHMILLHGCHRVRDGPVPRCPRDTCLPTMAVPIHRPHRPPPPKPPRCGNASAAVLHAPPKGDNHSQPSLQGPASARCRALPACQLPSETPRNM